MYITIKFKVDFTNKIVPKKERKSFGCTFYLITILIHAYMQVQQLIESANARFKHHYYKTIFQNNIPKNHSSVNQWQLL